MSSMFLQGECSARRPSVEQYSQARRAYSAGLLRPAAVTHKPLTCKGLLPYSCAPLAPVAQLDRVPGYEPGGRTFESCQARQIIPCLLVT